MYSSSFWLNTNIFDIEDECILYLRRQIQLIQNAKYTIEYNWNKNTKLSPIFDIIQLIQNTFIILIDIREKKQRERERVRGRRGENVCYKNNILYITFKFRLNSIIFLKQRIILKNHVHDNYVTRKIK